MFLADESVDRQIVERLRREGHDVLYVAEMEPGLSDDVVFERANASARILVTCDKDFGELTFRQGLVSSGVVLIRLGEVSASARADAVVRAISQHRDELPGAFVVVSPGLVRIRRRAP
jgi:predicted nuclease of predicted toxin-antitoxin system